MLVVYFTKSIKNNIEMRRVTVPVSSFRLSSRANCGQPEYSKTAGFFVNCQIACLQYGHRIAKSTALAKRMPQLAKTAAHPENDFCALRPACGPGASVCAAPDGGEICADPTIV